MRLQKLAGADHTTLLLNCYTKLKDVSKLDAFLRGSGATDSSTPPPFDAETAVKVSGMHASFCRASQCDRHLPHLWTRTHFTASDSKADDEVLLNMTQSPLKEARPPASQSHFSELWRRCWVQNDSSLHLRVQVCRSAGYYEHALAVSQAASEPEWYLDILLEDCQQYDEALAYLQKLPRQQAAAALARHGKVGEQCC